MKQLIIFNGTMGVGKTTLSQALKQALPAAVFLDGDWCWDSHPFIVNARTKAMVMENISFLLNQFLAQPDYQNVVFCWVIPSQEIMDDLLSRLHLEDVKLFCFSLIASASTLESHLQKDISSGKREADVISRSLAYQKNYFDQRTIKINVDGKDPALLISEVQIYLGGKNHVSTDSQ